MNKTSVSAAVKALDRLTEGSTSGNASADSEQIRAVLSELSGMAFRDEWAVHVDGEPMWCESKDKALSLLNYCLRREPDGASHLLHRDNLLGVWKTIDAKASEQETHV